MYLFEAIVKGDFISDNCWEFDENLSIIRKELQQFMYFSHSISIIRYVSYQGLFLKKLPHDLCK